MTKWIIHGLVLYFVVRVVSLSFTYTDNQGETNPIYQLLALILAGVYLGFLFVIYILPAISQKATNLIYDSGAKVDSDSDPFHDARAAHARGDYAEAISFYLNVTNEDPYNRLPWVEIAKIQHDNLENPDAAIQTLRNALESHDWAPNDAAYFMSRLSTLYIEDKHDRVSGVSILKQMIETCPDTRHSVNAKHKLRELGTA